MTLTGRERRSRCWRWTLAPRSSLVRYRYLGAQKHAERLADTQAVGSGGPRLDQVHELVALIEAVDHRRGVFGHGCDEIDLGGEIGRAVVAGNTHLVADRELRQIRLRHVKPHL